MDIQLSSTVFPCLHEASTIMLQKCPFMLQNINKC